jgi:hypothetical protein
MPTKAQWQVVATFVRAKAAAMHALRGCRAAERELLKLAEQVEQEHGLVTPSRNRRRNEKSKTHGAGV